MKPSVKSSLPIAVILFAAVLIIVALVQKWLDSYRPALLHDGSRPNLHAIRIHVRRLAGPLSSTIALDLVGNVRAAVLGLRRRLVREPSEVSRRHERKRRLKKNLDFTPVKREGGGLVGSKGMALT